MGFDDYPGPYESQAQIENRRLRQDIERLQDETRVLYAERDELLQRVRDAESALTTEVAKLQGALSESRANDRAAMSYLSEVRAIVGGKDFPDMVRRVLAQSKELKQLQKTVKPEESPDLG